MADDGRTSQHVVRYTETCIPHTASLPRHTVQHYIIVIVTIQYIVKYLKCLNVQHYVIVIIQYTAKYLKFQTLMSTAARQRCWWLLLTGGPVQTWANK